MRFKMQLHFSVARSQQLADTEADKHIQHIIEWHRNRFHRNNLRIFDFKFMFALRLLSLFYLMTMHYKCRNIAYVDSQIMHFNWWLRAQLLERQK